MSTLRTALVTEAKRDAGACEFCDEFAGGVSNSFARLHSNRLGSRLISTQHGLNVLPTLGQITPGHLLLVPRHHYTAFADMPASELEAADAMKKRLTELMRPTYGDTLFFEHGVRTPGAGGCGISHAHLHIVPFPSGKEPIDELTRAFPFERISDFTDLGEIQPGRSYLYYESLDGSKHVFYPESIPSQHIRRLLAEALANHDWDWRRYGKEEDLFTTFSQASQLFAARNC
jgi:diadenosine tetraphosphate (Ap4A) HIT family hydrolase